MDGNVEGSLRPERAYRFGHYHRRLRQESCLIQCYHVTGRQLLAE